MVRSQETFNKKEVRDKKAKKRKEKEQKRQERKEKGKTSFEDMIAYVDKNGMITSTPPEEQEKKEDIKLEDIEIGVPKKSEIEEDPVRNGVVSFFNESKGYGFIKDSISKESIFVHANNCIDEITEGNKVSFETERGNKGLVAIKVQRI